MSDKRGIQLTKEFEGFRDKVYLCSNDKLTTGWGHHLALNSYFPKNASQILFKQDYQTAELEYESLNFSLDPIRRIVIIDLIFNMGFSSFLDFTRMIRALRKRDFQKAADELIDSKYFKIDHKSKDRALANVKTLRTGRFN